MSERSYNGTYTQFKLIERVCVRERARMRAFFVRASVRTSVCITVLSNNQLFDLFMQMSWNLTSKEGLFI